MYETNSGMVAWDKITYELVGRRRPPRILVADDDEEMRTFLVWVLSKQGYDVIECSTGLRLLEKLGSFVLSDETDPIDLIISDNLMPGVTGIEVLEGLHEFEGFPPIIMITAFGDKVIHERARELGAFDLLDKPFQLGELLGRVQEIVGPPPIPPRPISEVDEELSS